MYITDDNLGFTEAIDMVTASVDIAPGDDAWAFSLYCRNLLDEVIFGIDTGLPDMAGPLPLGGTIAPLQKGRQVGVQVQYYFL